MKILKKDNSKDSILEYIRKRVYKDKTINGVETREISEALNMQRSNVSALLNEMVKDGLLTKTDSRPVYYNIYEREVSEKSAFTYVVGHNGSLKNVVKLAQAAILYPKRSLNVLIVAKPGCGTSFFVKQMHQFAIEKEVFSKQAPFVKINCRYYSKNISLINNDLFGDDGTTSYFEKAKGGMLFVDGFDLLDGKQQSRILHFLETNKINYDNQDSIEYNDVYLVLSLTQTTTLSLGRKIPVIIELPELKDWTFEERFELISSVFIKEAINSERTIRVNNDVIRALLLGEYTYNVKELNNEILKACANAYLRIVNDDEKDINVYIDDFPTRIKRNLLLAKEYRKILDSLLGLQQTFIFGDENTEIISKENVYSSIKKQYDEMINRGIDSDSIEDVMNKYIKKFLDKYSYTYENDEQGHQRLSKIVDKRIIPIVANFIDKFQQEKNKKLKNNVFYGLCFHINSLLYNKVSKQRITNDQIVGVIQNYPDEYVAASQLATVLKKQLNLELDISETVILTLFLLESENEIEENRPVLLYIMHGQSTAKSLCDVTNALTQSNNAYSYDLTLESDTNVALEEIKLLIKKIDNGAGVIVVYDMGSIKTMIDTILEEIDVKIRYFNIPITLVGIDIARKCSMEKDIDNVYHSVNLEFKKWNRTSNKNQDIIITLCHTGEGGAVQLKNYIDKYSLLNMKTIALSISNREALLKEINNLRKVYNIHAFVGTYDPRLLGIPFISISTIFENERDDLDQILMFEPVRSKKIDYTLVYENIESQFKYTSIAKLKEVLPGVVDELSIMYNMDNDQTLGLFMHIANVIERILSKEKIQAFARKNEYIESFSSDYKNISKIMKRLEKAFKIIIDDNEIAILIMIVKKL